MVDHYSLRFPENDHKLCIMTTPVTLVILRILRVENAQIVSDCGLFNFSAVWHYVILPTAMG